jgi:hypothetical protein
LPLKIKSFINFKYQNMRFNKFYAPTVITLFIFSFGKILAQKPNVPPAPSATYNIVEVHSINDLPRPVNGEITLNATKIYTFSGFVDISPNFINTNGAGLKGNDPSKDGVMSAVKGAVLNSTDVDVYMEKLAVIPLSPITKGYNFIDNTSTRFCNLLAGNSVIELPKLPSAGVGTIFGFNSVYITGNFWKCRDGLKLNGPTGKFCSSFNYVNNISAGSAIEFLNNFSANDIDLSNNYFVFSGQIAVKMDEGSTVDQARMSGNLFRGVGTPLSGFDSHTPGWQMRQNGAAVPDTKPYGFMYMNDNYKITKFISPTLYTKINGKTNTVKANSFTAADNRFTYTGRRTLTAKVYVNVGATPTEGSSNFSIAILKNGLEQVAPNASKATDSKTDSFQIILETEIDLITGDYVEVFIKNNLTTSSILVNDLQFRVSE